MTASEQAELEVLEGNLAAGVCVGKPASKRQQAIRRRRIKELRG